MARASTQRAVRYPESDGKPLAETGVHVVAILMFLAELWRRCDQGLQASALSNMFLYYEEGNPKKRVAPDIFVTLGVPDDRLRRTFRVWEEGKAPDLIVEVTSKSTRKEDLQTKFALYRDVLKVREYVLFDPLSEYLKPSLQGYRLIDGEYKPIELIDGRLPSEVIGYHLGRVRYRLRLYDPSTGALILTDEERAERAEADARRAEADARRAEADARRAEEDKQTFVNALRESEQGRRQIEEELDRLRRENEALKRSGSNGA